uniref:Poliovirus receptor-related protein-like factor variant 1 n=1 Tax=Plethodon cinereus TaxID=141976 RepID=W8Q4J8_9SALA|nr:poliovirus receptor-related protein-like factor variant 1 [Plethodon cinereus]AHL39280.1 poliovirus receptor-related protein-like factor variant 2 [Plethodon cinereus]
MHCLLCLLPLLLLNGVFAEKVLAPWTITATRTKSVIIKCQQPHRFVTIVHVAVGPCDNPNLAVFEQEGSASALNDKYPYRYSLAHGHAFKINVVECSDAGEYCCKINTFPEGSLTRKISLKVKGCTEGELADEFYGGDSTRDYV